MSLTLNLFRRSSTNSRPSVSELVSQLDNVSITTTPDRSMTPRPSSSQTPLSSASRSNSIQQTLHSISEQPNNDQTSTVASEKQRVYRQRSDELVRKPRETAAEVSLSRKESMNSSSSSVGYDANFPPPPSSAYEEEQVQDDEEEEEVPDDIKITMQKIRHSSRDPTPPTRASPPPASTIPPSHQSPPPQQQPTQVSEPEIELIPEPATDKLPDAYFQPNFIADLRLNMRDDNPVSGSTVNHRYIKSRARNKKTDCETNHAVTARRDSHAKSEVHKIETDEKYFVTLNLTVVKKRPWLGAKLKNERDGCVGTITATTTVPSSSPPNIKLVHLVWLKLIKC